MGAANKRGVWVPGANDDLLAGWQTMAGQIGAYVPVASVTAARSLLDEALTAGIGASTSNPILFLVGSGAQKVAYTADGSKSNNVWTLAPINEVEVAENTATATTVTGLPQFTFKPFINSTLPARSYDRIVTATGYSYGSVTAGIVNLGLRIGSANDQAEARWDSADAGIASVSNSGIIPANTAPVIQLGAVGDKSGVNSAVSVGSAAKHSRLVVTAYPITMTA